MKHPHQFELDSYTSRIANKESVAAALAVLQKGTSHIECEVLPPVSDSVGRGLCRIGSTQQPVSPGSRNGREDK